MLGYLLPQLPLFFLSVIVQNSFRFSCWYNSSTITLIALLFGIFKKKAIGDKEAVQDKKKLPVTEAVDKDKEVSISLLNIQVGLIRKAWKHPSADRYAQQRTIYNLLENNLYHLKCLIWLAFCLYLLYGLCRSKMNEIIIFLLINGAVYWLRRQMLERLNCVRLLVVWQNIAVQIS